MEKDGPLDGDVAAGSMAPPRSTAEVFFLGTLLGTTPLCMETNKEAIFLSCSLASKEESAVRGKEELKKD